MSLIHSFISFFTELDTNLIAVIQNYGILAYPLLFIIVFLETGIVFTPFLPGDSLIFVAGTLAASGLLNIFLLFTILALAAILGDTANYWIGRYFGCGILAQKCLKQEYLTKTQNFYEKHGGKTIILARFIPIVRTFAPFVAGIGKMRYSRFLSYNIVGGLMWVTLFLFTGFFFGNLPLIKENLTLVILIIIFLSILPAIIEYIKHKKHQKN